MGTGAVHRCRLVLLAAALPAAAGAGTGDRYPAFTDAHLAAGRVIWVDNCMTCHGYGIAGAPDPNKAKAWAHRLEKPRETLYDHALNGFFGPDGTMMPARGGHEDLTDAEVKLAVDYMAAVAQRANELARSAATTEATQATPGASKPEEE